MTRVFHSLQELPGTLAQQTANKLPTTKLPSPAQYTEQTQHFSRKGHAPPDKVLQAREAEAQAIEQRIGRLEQSYEQIKSRVAVAQAELERKRVELSGFEEALTAEREEQERKLAAACTAVRDKWMNVPQAQVQELEQRWTAVERREELLAAEEERVSNRAKAVEKQDARIGADADALSRRTARAAAQEGALRQQRLANREDAEKVRGGEQTLRIEKRRLHHRAALLRDEERRIGRRVSGIERRERICSEREASLQKEEKERQRQVRDLRRKLRQTNGELHVAKSQQAPWLFDEAALKCLPNNAELCQEILGRQVVTLGNGPLDESEFDSFLEQCGLVTHAFGNTDVGVFVVGRDGWRQRELDQQVEAREGKSLKVYSQEMVFIALAAGGDPFELGDRTLLLNLAKGHPALDYLTKSGFDWPSAALAGDGGGVLVVEGWVKHGLLRSLGYTVGHSGLGESERRPILEEAMTKTLKPGTIGDYTTEYLRQWGQPSSKVRLRRTAKAMATFVRLKKGMSNAESYKTAINHWEADLAWLKRKYYRPSMRFRWPSTYVR